jgi:hypothetical protein
MERLSKSCYFQEPHSKHCFLNHFSSRLKSVRGRVQEIKIIDYSDVSMDDRIELE